MYSTQIEATLARLIMREHGIILTELPHAGSRNIREQKLCKQFFLVSAPADDSQQHRPCPPPLNILSLMPPPPGFCNTQHHTALAQICERARLANHPFVLPAHQAQVHTVELRSSQERTTHRRIAVMRSFVPDGSLRDALNSKASPNIRKPYSSKYAQRAGGSDIVGSAVLVGGNSGEGVVGTALGITTVAVFGRQLLEALRFLRALGVPGTHVHAGNLMLDTMSADERADGDGAVCCRVSEFELALLGAPPYPLLLARPHPACEGQQYSVAPDVLAFGHVMHFVVAQSPAGNIGARH